MCGISGLVGAASDKVNTLIWAHQYKRGPDAKGAWSKDNITLLHNRLSIIDLSETGSQPMESSTYVLVFNGEIYRHLALRQKLDQMQWKGSSDTETLLNCIEHKGIEWTLDNLEGMFAFAVYDKYSDKLFFATDPFSIKPLYYYQDKDTFAFASSPGALTYLKDKWEFDHEALIDYLALGATRVPLFKGMKRVTGGSLLELDCKTLKLKESKWYKPKTHNITTEELIETVKQSIRSVKVADVPVFIFLSGGIDSTIVASQCEGMQAIHLNSPETQYAKQVAQKYNNKFILIDPRDYEAEKSLRDYSYQSGDCSMAAIIPYITTKETSNHCKVAISANGADELFFGYDRIFKNKTTKEQVGHIFRKSLYDKSNWHKNDNNREFELSTYVEYDLNKTLDFASMCHGLEVRVPYLNKSVVEQALSIDWATHTTNGVRPKAILKKFLLQEGFDLPFVTRPKIGFSLFFEPIGHEELKKKGLDFLKSQFNIDPILTGRDARYFESSAASFYIWFQTWESKLIL